MHSIKSYSANQINKIEGKSGIVWQNESYDRIIRDEAEFNYTLNYIWHNPIKSVEQEPNLQDYPWYFQSSEVGDAGWKPAPFGRINYVVWSDVFICPGCGGEIVFWRAAVDKTAGKVLDEFPCTHCKALQSKKTLSKAKRTMFDRAINETITQTKTVPVLINYTYNGKRYEKPPDAFDLELIQKIEEMDIPYWFPTDALPEGYNTRQPMESHGYTHVHHFYTKRNLYINQAIYHAISDRVTSIL